MIVVKVNLLPGEIQDKRRAEKLILAGLIGMVAIAACLAGVFMYNIWRIDNAENDLVLLSDQVAKMESAIQELRVYEVRLAEVQKKREIVEKALADRIIWSKLLEELMIITPNDLSLATLSGNGDAVTFSGEIQDPLDAPDSGHKPVAKWLIRLGELRLQPDVWLSSSDKQEKKILFSNTMRFKKEPMQPAPPNPSGT